MSSNLIVTRFSTIKRHFQPVIPLDMHSLYLHPERLPWGIRGSSEAMHCLEMFGPLDWDTFPERGMERNYGQPSTPYAGLAAACLAKLEWHIGSFSRMTKWLAKTPSIAWVMGFRDATRGFNPLVNHKSVELPGERHFTRLLHKAPNICFQHLLESSIRLLLAEFAKRKVEVPDVISIDTKHIIAWVKENNPKAYVEERFDKTKQPVGDPDCRLGCKRRHNQYALNVTPKTNPVPADTVKVGEFYWGYASGVAAIKVPGWGEFVLAELTQPFDRPDVSYFYPLMQQVEQRLGKKPRYGALDAAFDAFYIYDYFHDAGGFAAIPLAEKGKRPHRTFDLNGLPLCAAGLSMPLKMVYHDSSTAIVEYERGQYACPLLYPTVSGQVCPIGDVHYANGGCQTTISTSPGARIRHQLERDGEAYRQVYKQRTAVERINSQAKELGIEHPHLRNGLAIANLNTLIYTLINLRLLNRIQKT